MVPSGYLCPFHGEVRRCRTVHRHPSWYPGGACDRFGSVDVYTQPRGPRTRWVLTTPRAECAHRLDETRDLPACGWEYPHLGALDHVMARSGAPCTREGWNADGLRLRQAIFSRFRCTS